MAIDWDDLVLSSVMDIFGEGNQADRSSLPLYTCKTGEQFLLADAVFDEAYADIQLDGEATDNTTRKPCLGVRLARFAEAGAPDPAQGDIVDLPGRGSYLVKDPRSDGHGHARLILMGPMA